MGEAHLSASRLRVCSIIDSRQHSRGIDRNHDINDRGLTTLDRLPQHTAKQDRVVDSCAKAPKLASDRSIVNIKEIDRDEAITIQTVLKRLYVTERTIVDDDNHNGCPYATGRL
jgi:hypothetical protein